MITESEVKGLLPSGVSKSVVTKIADELNKSGDNDIENGAIRDNFIGYISVLREGNFKTDEYLNAVKYVTFKLMGDTNKDAYIKTFPKRYARLMVQEVTDKQLSSYVSMYNKGKLVNMILEQSLVPTWVLNQDVYQKAINVQAQLMISSPSDYVRVQAANSLLTQLKKPEVKGPLVNIDMRETSGIKELKATLRDLAQEQLKTIDAGVTAKVIAEQKLSEDDPE